MKCFACFFKGQESPDKSSVKRERSATEERIVLTQEEVPEAAAGHNIVAFLRRRSSAAHSNSIEEDYDGLNSGKLLGTGVSGKVPQLTCPVSCSRVTHSSRYA